jgi:hypothetical protein
VSNPLAIAAVTASFAQLLGRVDEDPNLTGAVISMGPPDAVTRPGKERQLNLFLYAITPDAAWRDADLPGRRPGGDPDRPALAVELHYVLTAYGEGDHDLDAQRLLGKAMMTLQDNPVLSPDQIAAAQEALATTVEPGLPQQADLVRISLQKLSIGELSRVWGMFPDTPYRLSIGCQASPILI